MQFDKIKKRKKTYLRAFCLFILKDIKIQNGRSLKLFYFVQIETSKSFPRLIY